MIIVCNADDDDKALVDMHIDLFIKLSCGD